jgi:hypothetical protein
VPAVRQKLHLSSCPDVRPALFSRATSPPTTRSLSTISATASSAYAGSSTTLAGSSGLYHEKRDNDLLGSLLHLYPECDYDLGQVKMVGAISAILTPDLTISIDKKLLEMAHDSWRGSPPSIYSSKVSLISPLLN